MPEHMYDRTGAISRLLLRVPVPWVFVLTYLAGLCLQINLSKTSSKPDNHWFTGAGIVLFALGVILAGWGWLIFHKVQTTRVPGQTSTRLVTWGPYKITRNPMYVGLTLAYLGEAAMLHQLWPPLLLPLTIIYLNRVVIPVEEAVLHKVFGDVYEQYRTRVRRWL
jgi:protein-S-isoprenylcysteine O-methyltransferase Ste14